MLLRFAKKAGLQITPKVKKRMVFPPQERLKGEINIAEIKQTQNTLSAYQVKAGQDCQTTGKVLDKMGVSYNFLLRIQNMKEYVKYLGEDKVVKMPLIHLGQGSIPARNFYGNTVKKGI